MTPLKFLIILIVLASATSIVVFWEVYQSPPFVKKKDTQVNTTLLPKIYEYPVKIPNFQKAMQISAKSAVVVDVKSGLTLFEKNPQTRLLPASTTKLMTALVALQRCHPDQPVTVTFVEKEPTSMGLEPGDTIAVKSLLYGLLVSSGNDAAYALAYSCANTVPDFVNEMNQKAKELGLKNSHFANPTGFDDPAQFTTSYDLAKLARVAVASPLIAKIVSTKSTVVTDVAKSKTYYLENVNKLLGDVEGLEGVKTGQTEGSLEVMITQTTRDNHTIITVVLGSQDRFEESKNLIEWAFANHQWVEP